MDNLKKICFVCEYMLCGGVEKSLISLLNLLPHDKYEVTVLLLQKKGELLDEIPSWVHVREIDLPEEVRDDLLYGKWNALKHAIRTGHFVRAAKKAITGLQISYPNYTDDMKRVRYYNRIEPLFQIFPKEFDVAIDYMGYGLLNTFYTAKKIKAKRKLAWIHFDIELSMGDISAYTCYFDDYDELVCVSKEIKDKMLRKLPQYKDKYRVFYNVINRKEILQKAQIGVECFEKTDGISIVSVGRLDPPKGFDLALHSFAKLKDEGYKFHWYIVGEGHQREKLEALIQELALRDFVTLLGKQLNPYPFVNQCDLYFQPSRHEAYGIAVAEARMLYKPILCTDFAGAKEQFVDGKTARIVKCDVDSLYTGLKEMFDSPELRNLFSNNLEKQYLSADATLEKFESLIEE